LKLKLALEKITTEPVDFLSTRSTRVSILRLDKIHPVISGNKWFKLQYYLDDALRQGYSTITTFGGAYSNHIVATAAACREEGLNSIGIIRGEASASSPTLEQARELGMRLFFTSRADFKAGRLPAEIDSSETYIIEEGGYGEKGAAGAGAILNFTPEIFTHYCCAVGTGTMMAGLASKLGPTQQVIGISTMKNNLELEQQVRKLVGGGQAHWNILHDYHFGGYAKSKPALITFMNELYRHTGIPTDFVYTGKMIYAVADLVQQDFFPGGSRLLLIHSGGLQGNRSLPPSSLIF
jgi:1-aminocyclopropane-1-carboxylate deaminase